MIGTFPIMDSYLIITYEGNVIKEIKWQREPVNINLNFPFYHLFNSYFNGKRVDFSEILLDFSNISPFYKRVYEMARKIPCGKITSYKILAEKLGCKKGARAVGQAISKNPFLIIIPCHRVIKSNGEIGRFGLGEDFKKFLLKLEGIKEAENGRILSLGYWWY